MASSLRRELPGHPDHRGVGLVLREGLLQQFAGLLRTHPVEQVDGHVVARPERRPQRVEPLGGEAGDRPRVHPRRPHHHRVALDVDAATAGPAGELGVLPRGQVDVALAVVLDQPLQDDGAGRHVDAQRQRLGGEHGLDQAGDEQLLDGLLERRQQPGVVRGDAALQSVAPLPVAENGEVGLRQLRGPPVDDGPDLGPLRLGGQPQTRVQALLDGGVAAGPGEDERDGGQQAVAVQPLDDVGAGHRPEALPSRLVSRRPGTAAAAEPAVPGLGLRRRPGQRRVDPGLLAGCSSLSSAVFIEAKRSYIRRPTIMCWNSGTGRCSSTTTVVWPRTSCSQAPNSSALLTVADRPMSCTRQVGVQDDLLPHRPAELVGQVVDLVHHHRRQTVQIGRVGVEHVAQHLGGHHHDRCVRVDRGVAGEQADVLRRRGGPPGRRTSGSTAP